MAIKLGQSLKQSQNLTMTPQLQQAIKMLAMTHLEMADVISQEMVENPTLEEAGKEFSQEDLKPKDSNQDKESQSEIVDGGKDQFDWDSYVDSYNASSSSAPSGVKERYSKDDFINYENMVSAGKTLVDHLEWQLRMEGFIREEWEFAVRVLHNLKEDGYLENSFEEIFKNYCTDNEKESKSSLSLEEAQTVLGIIQSSDPVGCASHNLQECLLIQAYHLKPTPHLVITIINDYLDLIKEKKYDDIAEATGARVEEIIDAENILASFTPKPGYLISSGPVQYIAPDIYVRFVGEDLQISLNDDGIPRLRVSKLYQEMMKADSGKKAKNYIKDKLRSALWLIKSIENRQKTIEKVSRSIVERQPDFFKKGAAYLKPMILKDIAQEIGVHESTVSRATTNKYMHTPLGIYELKFFFNSSIGAKNGGVDIAAEGLKMKIKELIDQESKKKPLSDQKIVEMLGVDQIIVARRTIAKYREMMDIPSSSKRKMR